MKVEELEKLIRKAVREELKYIVSESINTSISTIFKVITENKEIFTTKEIIRETIQTQPINQTPVDPKNKNAASDAAIRKYRQQLNKEISETQSAAFRGINPHQVVNETKKQPQQKQSQKFDPTKSKTSYLNLIENMQFDNDEDDFDYEDEILED